jgi:hypothetical protein
MSTLHYYRPYSGPVDTKVIDCDVCVYGGTPAGIAAAMQIARLGKRVVLLEFGKRIGGIVTSGLGATDIGNKHVIGGISRQFFRDVGVKYGVEEKWHFEPHIALQVYQEWLDSAGIPVYIEHRLSHIEKKHGRIASLQTENGCQFRASIYIDAGYEGDLMARAGVQYRVGRESDSVYDEHYNGIHYGSPHHNFFRFVDPYRKPGDPSSGLLPNVSEMNPGRQGEGDDLIQAYNFRLCLTKEPGNRVSFPKPANYDPEKYELLRRYIGAGIFDIFKLAVEIPGKKVDHNNWGGFNTDFIGANYGWPDGDYRRRERIYQEHVNYVKGLFWFCANDPRLPPLVREIAGSWGFAADEFTDSEHFPPQLYIREARRMMSEYVMTEHDALGRFSPDDSVGMASYKMDSHNCKRIVKGGRALNEGNLEVAPLDPFPIPYRSIRPRRSECTNLLVTCCPSASHICFGSIRMEPVFMILGQSAGVAAVLSLDKNGIVQDISYSTLEQKLRSEGQILTEPEEEKAKLDVY